MTVQPEAPETEERSGLSRRTVIKGAAHAAWMVPAITVVTQAPALATSGSLTANGTGSWVGSSSATHIEASITVLNGNAKDTVAFALIATFPTGWNPNISNVDSTKWNVAKGGSPTSGGVTFTFTAKSQIAAGQSAVISAWFTPTNANNRNRAVNVALHPSGGQGASADGVLSVTGR